MDERLKEFYELRASEEPPNDPEAKLRFRKAIDAAGLRSGEAVLDLGAKWGGLAASIDVSVEYTGLDLSEVNAAAATNAGLTLVQGDVTQPLPFADAAFDCVFCLELLEHLIAPARLLAEIHRVLKADGRAVVSVPSPYSWVEVARELFGLHDTEGHLNAFTTPVMQNLAGLTGFSVERRLGTSLRLPKMSRLVSTNSILARSRIYVLRPTDDLVFAGRPIPR
ncbi:MAG TPA: class I SAM-dependent methyltransferase [Gaiellaceae bacterium]|nr:class I SAM-dependent methyltransferase [Gaiellaceae bacterium]